METGLEKLILWIEVNAGTIDLGNAYEHALELAIEEAKESDIIGNVSISLPDYEYEMLIDDEGTPFEINSWIPIATDRIKDPSRIDEYIAKGLMRKRQ